MALLSRRKCAAAAPCDGPPGNAMREHARPFLALRRLRPVAVRTPRTWLPGTWDANPRARESTAFPTTCRQGFLPRFDAAPAGSRALAAVPESGGRRRPEGDFQGRCLGGCSLADRSSFNHGLWSFEAGAPFLSVGGAPEPSLPRRLRRTDTADTPRQTFRGPPPRPGPRTSPQATGWLSAPGRSPSDSRPSAARAR